MIFPTRNPRTEARLEQIAAELASLRCLTQELIRMSETQEQLLQDGIGAVRTDLATIATATAATAAAQVTIAAEIAQLQAQLQPGATISPADIDSINALKTQADAAAAAAQAAAATAQEMANPPAPPPPAGP